MSVAFQFLDVAVVLIVIVSAIYAMYRGFVSESLSIFAWVGAAFATLYFGPWVAHWMRQAVTPPWLGEVAGYGAVFLVVVIPLSFASFRISQTVKKSPVGTLDSSFGLAFGVVRGLVIVGVAYLIFSSIVPIPEQPGWVAKARLLPLIQGSAEVIASLVPDQQVGRDARATEQRPQKPQQNTVTGPETAKSTPVPAPKPTGKKTHRKTYGAKDRHALDRLIEATGSDGSGKP